MRVGAVGDPHFPFTHPMYRRFCLDVFERNRVDKISFAGDLFDNHALSFHEHDPDGYSAGCEYKHARRIVQRWYRDTQDSNVCVGNHDARNFRLAKKVGLPKAFLKDYAEVWDTPTWKWDFEHRIDGVLYTHGTGVSGKDAAINLAIQRRMSVVIGHIHSWAGAKFHANSDNLIFGMNVGCGIDVRAYAFAYGKDFPTRPILGCGVVIDGEQPIFFPMPCGRGDKYHRSRASKADRKLYKLN